MVMLVKKTNKTNDTSLQVPTELQYQVPRNASTTAVLSL